MPTAPTSSANSVKKQTKLSTWTPLNHPVINSKVFEERRTLLAKWFDRWSDSQRKAVLQDFGLSCSVDQLRFLSLTVSRLLPLQAADFTCLLPRVLSLYIFSHLDPRSLCRCAQVSWHWKSIVELDQLWMPKCLRLGWYMSFSPTQYEQGVWKRHYIQTVQELQVTPPQFVVPSVTLTSSGHDETSQSSLQREDRPASTSQPLGSSSKSALRKERQSAAAAPPPWKVNDRCPKDTLRFNYLDNMDPNELTLREQKKNRTTTCRSLTVTPDSKLQKSLSEANYKLRKAKSLMFLSSNSTKLPPPPPAPAGPLPPHHLPPHTQTQFQLACGSNDHPVTKETTTSLLRQAQCNAGIRPGPVRSAIPRLSVEAVRASQRTHRSTPSIPLF